MAHNVELSRLRVLAWERKRERQHQQLLTLEATVRELYIVQQFDCLRMRQELLKMGHKFSYKVLLTFLKSLGILRPIVDQRKLSKSAEHLRWQRTCEICKQPFTALSKKGRWCDVCVPKISEIGESAQLWGGYARKFGMTKADYETMLKLQGNACAICHKSFISMPKQDIHVDHDHKTNRVRGILCLYCNRGIGCFFDSPAALRTAAIYLE